MRFGPYGRPTDSSRSQSRPISSREKKDEESAHKLGASMTTGDAVRDRVRRDLADLFRASHVYAEEDCEASPAAEIETAMFAAFGGTGRDYRQKYRQLLFNLRRDRNPELHDKIVQKEVSAEDVVQMTATELACQELKEQRKKWEAEHEYHLTRSNTQSTTDMFRCGKCGKRECTYYQMQTRRADEPMTTFVTCTNCGKRWKC